MRPWWCRLCSRLRSAVMGWELLQLALKMYSAALEFMKYTRIMPRRKYKNDYSYV